MSTLNHYPRLTGLARTFPTLRNGSFAGIDPFDPEMIRRDLGRNPAHSRASREAARFVLDVFNNGVPGKDHFNVVAALASWDDEHRRAFLAWAEQPWWG